MFAFTESHWETIYLNSCQGWVNFTSVIYQPKNANKKIKKDLNKCAQKVDINNHEVRRGQKGKK